MRRIWGTVMIINNWKTRMKIGEKKSLIPDILRARGIKDPNSFLYPSTYYNEISPYEFKNMDRAVACTKKHLADKKKILVIFDVDVDGITSGSITYRALRDIEANIDWIIGDGKKHGVSQHGIEKLSQYDLVIACDSLSNEYVFYEQLYATGTHLILLDHHHADKESDYAIVVNSEMFDSPNTSLSGAGVAWKFSCALYDEMGLDEPELADIASVGLIADVMDMSVIDNRVICDKGFNKVRNRGLKFLLGKEKMTSDFISYELAPLINACNRMNKNEISARFFLEDNKTELYNIKREMEKCKRDQKKEVNYIVDHVDIQKDVKDNFILTIMGEDKNPNHSGLVGNKLAEKYGIPTIILYDDPEKQDYTGSIRAPNEMPLKDIIKSTGFANAEGHQGAAGIWFDKNNLEQFQVILAEKIADTDFEIAVPTADCELEEKDVTNVLLNEIAYANRITGNGFPKISFLFMNVEPYTVDYLGKEMIHTKIVGKSKGMEFVKWNDTDPVDNFGINKYKTFDIIGTPYINNFAGKKTKQCIIDHIYYEKEEVNSEMKAFYNLEEKVEKVLDDKFGDKDSLNAEEFFKRETMKLAMMEASMDILRKKGVIQ